MSLGRSTERFIPATCFFKAVNRAQERKQIHSMVEDNDKAIYHVLADIHQESGNISIQDTITYLTEHRPAAIFPKPEIERAVEQCLEAGWIKVLSEQDCEDDRLRWIDDPHQNWSENLDRVGCVDFTSEGWNVYAKLVNEHRRIPLEDLYRQSVQYIWRMPGRVSILSMSEEELLRERAEVVSGSDGLTSDGSLSADHKVGEITGPYAIGSWWVNRFYLAPYGYRVDVSFEPANMHS